MTLQFSSVRKYPSLEIINAKAQKKAELFFSLSGTSLAVLLKCALGACVVGPGIVSACGNCEMGTGHLASHPYV